MDTIWPLGFVLIAVVSFDLSAGSGDAGRRVLVLALTAVWGLRLGALLEKHMTRSHGPRGLFPAGRGSRLRGGGTVGRSG
jgi:steroid 5-alpha reductase family enzyme